MLLLHGLGATGDVWRAYDVLSLVGQAGGLSAQ
jgi:hypothetical protein